jgi:hypothetical protein
VGVADDDRQPDDRGRDNTVSLPADFGELITVAGQTAPFLTKRFRRVSPQQIVRIRQQATAVTADAEAKTTLFYALTGKAQASVTAMRLYQLQLYPTPTTGGGTAVASAFYVVYRANPPTSRPTPTSPTSPPTSRPS